MAEYKNISELFGYWEENGYPDYVCGIWSTSGDTYNLTVAVNREEAKDEVLSLIEDDSSVSFAYQTYSKNILLNIIDEMNSRFCEYEYANETGFKLMSLNEYENRVEITFDDEKAEYTPTLELINELENRFGDAVYIEFSDVEFVYTDELVLDAGNPITYAPEREITALESNISTCCIILAVSLLILSIAFILQNKRALRLTNGEIITRDKVSVKEIERSVKASSFEVPPELDQRIKKALDDY